jgi:hypothetical protein
MLPEAADPGQGNGSLSTLLGNMVNPAVKFVQGCPSAGPAFEFKNEDHWESDAV